MVLAVIVGLVSWFDEPVENIARCLLGLQLAGAGHVVALDGRYSLYPGVQISSDSMQHAGFVQGCKQLGMGCTMSVPREPWAGNEAEKRTALFAHGLAVADPGDWFLVVDADEFITEAPADLPDRLAMTDREVVEIQALDVVAARFNRRDWPSRFPVRKLFRAQPITVGPAHSTYRAGDGRLLWGQAREGEREADTLELLDVLVEHHPHRRPNERQAAKLAYYSARDANRIERGGCHWCAEPATDLVALNWRMHAGLGCPVAEWREACRNHLPVADRIARVQLEAMGIDPATVRAENRMGRPREVPA